MSAYTKVITRPDPRVPGAWCQEGATHDHDACGALWNSASPRDVEEAARWAEERGDRLRRQITVTRTKIRLIERDGTWVFGVTFPEREEFVMSSHATAGQLAEVIASARAQQIRAERAQTAPPAAVGDVLGANDPIPSNVTEVRTADGHWRRAVGDERYAVEDNGHVDRSIEYDWVTVGGWASTDGLYDYLPIVVDGIA